MSDLERNRQIVLDFYRTGFGGDPRKAAADYLGATYIQHNPIVADGPDGFITLVEYMRAQNPDMKLDIKRVFAEGDMVITHSHLTLTTDDAGLAVADFYRIQDGKIVEHWDVIQQIPAEASNSNGMF